MDYSQFGTLLPEIIVLGVFLIVFLFDTFSGENGKKAVTPLAVVLFGIATVAMWFVPTCTADAFAGMYATNAATMAIKNVLNLGVFIVLLQAIRWTDTEDGKLRRGEFFELLFVTLFGMYLMISARHFLLFIIGLESASLPLAAMVAFDKRRYESNEAAIKYIMTAVFSSAVLLMGVSFVYACSGTGSLYFSDIAAAIGSSAHSAMLITALAFVLAGIGFKLSLVPSHLWTADVYQGAPTAVTSYLSVISKGSAAFAFFIIFCQCFGTVYSQVWEWMLYAIIILTITVGNLFAIRQKNMKRFMAFSSVSQAGYIMLAVIGGSAFGMTSLVFYVLVYMAANLAVFGVVSTVEQHSGGKVGIEDYNGLYRTNPKLAVMMTLALFSLAGIPPFAGFFSKFFVFAAAFKGGFHLLVFIALINTVISLYYYLLIVKAMYITPSENPIPTFRSDRCTKWGLALCTLGIIGLGIASVVYQSIDKLAFGI